GASALSTTSAPGDESSSNSITCASRPCPAPRSITRPPRNCRLTRRAISHASYNSLRGRHRPRQTARASLWNRVGPGKRSRSRSVRRARDEGEKVATFMRVANDERAQLRRDSAAYPFDLRVAVGNQPLTVAPIVVVELRALRRIHRL